MNTKDVLFNRKINGIRYKIYTFTLFNGEKYMNINSAIPNDTPRVDSIEYCEETQTFQMTDYIKIGKRRVKVMFNLNLLLQIVGFIYNDFDGSYDMIEPSEYFSEDYGARDTDTVYNIYLLRLKDRLTKKLEEQEKKYIEDNQKILNLVSKNNQE